MQFGLRKISTYLDPYGANKAVPRSYYCFNYYGITVMGFRVDFIGLLFRWSRIIITV